MREHAYSLRNDGLPERSARRIGCLRTGSSSPAGIAAILGYGPRLGRYAPARVGNHRRNEALDGRSRYGLRRSQPRDRLRVADDVNEKNRTRRDHKPVRQGPNAIGAASAAIRRTMAPNSRRVKCTPPKLPAARHSRGLIQIAQHALTPARGNRRPESDLAMLPQWPRCRKIADTRSSSCTASRSSSRGGKPCTRKAAPNGAPSMQCARQSRRTRRAERHVAPWGASGSRLYPISLARKSWILGRLQTTQHGEIVPAEAVRRINHPRNRARLAARRAFRRALAFCCFS